MDYHPYNPLRRVNRAVGLMRNLGMPGPPSPVRRMPPEQNGTFGLNFNNSPPIAVGQPFGPPKLLKQQPSFGVAPGLPGMPTQPPVPIPPIPGGGVGIQPVPDPGFLGRWFLDQLNRWQFDPRYNEDPYLTSTGARTREPSPFVIGDISKWAPGTEDWGYLDKYYNDLYAGMWPGGWRRPNS